MLRSRVETSVGTEPAFTFSTHRARQLAPVVGSFGMAAGSAMLILAGRTAAGVGCTIIFGSWFLFMLFTATRPLQLALTPTRLLFGSAAKTAELPWAAVDGCDLFETSAGRGTATDVLGVAATDPRDAIWTRGRRMAAADRRASGYDVTLPAEAFVADAEAVIDAIHLYRDEPERRRAIGSEEELARLHRLPGLAGRT